MEHETDMGEESQQLFEDFIMKNGNSRVIAANGKIEELINKILEVESKRH
jgi:hypothetical protein